MRRPDGGTSFSAGEPGISQQVNSNDDQRHRRGVISSSPMAFGCFCPAGAFIDFGRARAGLPVALVVLPGYTPIPTFTGRFLGRCAK